MRDNFSCFVLRQVGQIHCLHKVWIQKYQEEEPQTLSQAQKSKAGIFPCDQTLDRQ